MRNRVRRCRQWNAGYSVSHSDFLVEADVRNGPVVLQLRNAAGWLGVTHVNVGGKVNRGDMLMDIRAFTPTNVPVNHEVKTSDPNRVWKKRSQP
jgi:hypothetical protein